MEALSCQMKAPAASSTNKRGATVPARRPCWGSSRAHGRPHWWTRPVGCLALPNLMSWLKMPNNKKPWYFLPCR